MQNIFKLKQRKKFSAVDFSENKSDRPTRDWGNILQDEVFSKKVWRMSEVTINGTKWKFRNKSTNSWLINQR